MENGNSYYLLPLECAREVDPEIKALVVDSLIGALLGYEQHDSLSMDYLDYDIRNKLYDENGDFRSHHDLEMLRDPVGYRNSLYDKTESLLKDIMYNNKVEIQKAYNKMNIRDVRTCVTEIPGKVYLNLVGVPAPCPVGV